MSVSDHACPACWRYGSNVMRAIFTEKNKLQYSLDVERALAEAEAELGIIPSEAAEEIRIKASTQYVTPEAVFEREKKIRHDVMAMVQLLTEACEGDAGKYVHLGATSYDIEDNRLALQMKNASEIISGYLVEFGRALKEKAKDYRDLPAIGRTHVQWAEPITFGHKFAKHLNDVWMDYKAWKDFLENILVGKPMTGAVGTSDSYVHLAGKEGAGEIGRLVMEKLGLKPATITDQIVTRKMHAKAAENLAQAAMTGYRFAQEFYDLWRPEIAEVMPRMPEIGVVGSSAMPHKTVLMNDIDGENIMSLAKMVKAFVGVAYDNIPTRHERDLTNSGNERIWIPQAYLYTDEILLKCIEKTRNMVVRGDRITENLEKATKFTVTEPLMMTLVEKGMGRQDAHNLLQGYARTMSQNPESDPVEVLMGIDEIAERITLQEAGDFLHDHRMYTGLSREFIDKVLEEADF